MEKTARKISGRKIEYFLLLAVYHLLTQCKNSKPLEDEVSTRH
jgi:hypothetical protein